MHATAPVTAQDDRLLAHGRDQVVAGISDLALVADEEPGAREHLLLLGAIDVLVDEDLAADDSAVDVDEAVQMFHQGHADLQPPRCEVAAMLAQNAPIIVVGGPDQ